MATPPRSKSPLVVFLRETVGYTPTHLFIDGFEWSCILFLLAGPFFFWHMDKTLTLICNNMAVRWTGPIMSASAS